MLGLTRHEPHVETASLPAGGTVLLFTDGLVEDRAVDLDDNLEKLRVAALQAADADVEAFANQVMSAFGSSEDDVAMIVRAGPGERRARPRPSPRPGSGRPASRGRRRSAGAPGAPSRPAIRPAAARCPRAAALSWAKMIACTPEESQKDVDVMSATTTSDAGRQDRDELLVDLVRSW